MIQLQISGDSVPRMRGRQRCFSTWLAAAGGGERHNEVFNKKINLLRGSQPMNAPRPESQSIAILIVEDEELVAMSTRMAFEELGIRAVCVPDGAQALRALDLAPFTAAIIDVGLPDIDGDEVVRRLRETDLFLPIVLCTGFDAVKYERQFQSDPHLRVIEKPFTEPELLLQLSKLGVDVQMT